VIILDTVNRRLQVLLSGAVTTQQLPFTAHYVDYNDSVSLNYNPGSSNGTTSDTVAVTWVAAPAAGFRRHVKHLAIHNHDSFPAEVNCRYDDNGTARDVPVVTLQTGDTLQYNDGEGWRVMDSTGAIKGTGPTGATGATGQDGIFGGDSLAYIFDSTPVDADPGATRLRFDNGTLGSVTKILISDFDENGTDQTPWIQALDNNATNSIRGRLRLCKTDDSSQFVIFSIIAGNSYPGGYTKVRVAYVTSSGSFANSDRIFISFCAAGDKGDTGATTVSVTSTELSVTSAQAASAINVVSAELASLETRLDGISALSSGTSVHGLQSVIDALSNRISIAGFASVTSNEASIISAQAASAINVVSARAASISAELGSLVQIASAAATSVNSRVTSVNAALSAISARSVGDVSTHGLQSVVNALSNRISVVAVSADGEALVVAWLGL